MCVRCMETEKHYMYCLINENAFIISYIMYLALFYYVFVMYSPLLSTMRWEIENQKANNTFFIVSSAEKRRGDWKGKQVDKNTQFYSNFRTCTIPMSFFIFYFNIVLKRYNQFHPLESFASRVCRCDTRTRIRKIREFVDVIS